MGPSFLSPLDEIGERDEVPQNRIGGSLYEKGTDGGTLTASTDRHIFTRGPRVIPVQAGLGIWAMGVQVVSAVFFYRLPPPMAWTARLNVTGRRGLGRELAHFSRADPPIKKW